MTFGVCRTEAGASGYSGFSPPKKVEEHDPAECAPHCSSHFFVGVKKTTCRGPRMCEQGLAKQSADIFADLLSWHMLFCEHLSA